MATSSLLPPGLLLAATLAFSASLSAATIQLDRQVDEALGYQPDVFHYAMEDRLTGGPEGYTTSDSSPNANHINVWTGNGNTPTLTTGRFGQGFNFDGTTGTTTNEAVNKVNPSLYRANSTSLDLSGKSFTMGLWLKFDAHVAPNYSYNIHLIGKGAQGTNQPGYWFYLSKSSLDGKWGLYFSATDNSGSSTEVSTGLIDMAVSLDSWHHFGLSYDYDTRRVIFYFNGTQVGEAINPTAIGQSNSSLLYLGERGISGWSGWFDGTMDDAFITQGVHTFSMPAPEPVPEPATLALMATGIGLTMGMRRFRKG